MRTYEKGVRFDHFKYDAVKCYPEIKNYSKKRDPTCKDYKKL